MIMTTRNWIKAGGLTAIFLVSASCNGFAQPAPVDIPFAPIEDTSLKDPDNPIKTFRVDFAASSSTISPCHEQISIKLRPDILMTLSQEQIDQIYGRLTAGPIPDGLFRGDLFFTRGETLSTRLEEILGGIKGRLADTSVEILEMLARGLWKGKVFDREQRVLRNMIENLLVMRPLVGDPSTITTTTIPRTGFAGRFLPGDRVWLLFPAKVYCGQSLLDARRESVIVDYNYNDEIEGYRASPDSLAGRGGLQIRDEIRMVRPGLYLGRAYANRRLPVELHALQCRSCGARSGRVLRPVGRSQKTAGRASRCARSRGGDHAATSIQISKGCARPRSRLFCV